MLLQVQQHYPRRRPHLIRLLSLAVLGLVVTGCTHTITLMAADGTMGTGIARGSGGGGTLEVQPEGRTFTGTWVAARGGSVGYGAVGRYAFSSVSESADSVGRAMLRAGDGSTLRCEFTYAGMSHAG